MAAVAASDRPFARARMALALVLCARCVLRAALPCPLLPLLPLFPLSPLFPLFPPPLRSAAATSGCWLATRLSCSRYADTRAACISPWSMVLPPGDGGGETAGTGKGRVMRAISSIAIATTDATAPRRFLGGDLHSILLDLNIGLAAEEQHSRAV